jgi:tetratricopeptide (TPR) repeat protein
MMKAFFIFFFMPFLAAAQAVPDTTGNAQTLVRINDWYVKVVRQADSAHAIPLLTHMLAQAERTNNPVQKSAALFYMGQYYAAQLNHEKKGEQLMNEAIALASRHGAGLQWALYTHHQGYYFFFHDKDYEKALAQLLKAHEVFGKIGYRNVPNQGYLLYQLAFVYYHLGNYPQALHWLQTTRENAEPERRVRILITSTIGQCHEKLVHPDSAILYYTKTYEMALAGHDTDWVGIAAGNIGAVFLQRKQYEKARPYYLTYYNLSRQTGSWIGTVEALTGLAHLDLAANHANLALNKLDSATALFEQAAKKEPLRVEEYPRLLSLYAAYAASYEATKNFSKAYRYQQRADAIRDSLDKRNRQTATSASVTTLTSLASQKSTPFNAFHVLKQHPALSISVLAVVFVAGGFYWRRQRKKRVARKLNDIEQARLLKEKDIVEASLLQAQQNLELVSGQERAQTGKLQKLESELEGLRRQPFIDESESIALTKLTTDAILTPADWLRFRAQFENAFPAFFARLLYKYPTLTPAETRLVALVRLGRSTPEMAAMLGVNPDTIKKTRQRLRKELGLATADSLEDLVASI